MFLLCGMKRANTCSTMRKSKFPIINKLGGVDAVRDALELRRHVVSEKAIRMWHAPGRGTIPGWAQPELMAIAELRRVPYSATDFMMLPEAA